MTNSNQSYTIHPQSESKGEGNGWYDCAENDATSWSVEDKHGSLEVFKDRASAEQHVRNLEQKSSDTKFISTIAIELTDLIQLAVSKYAVAYSHVTLTDMSTAMATWSVHETGHGDPFAHGVWEGQFDNKHDANQLAAKLRKEAAEAAVAKWLSDFNVSRKEGTVVFEVPRERAADFSQIVSMGYDLVTPNHPHYRNSLFGQLVQNVIQTLKE